MRCPMVPLFSDTDLVELPDVEPEPAPSLWDNLRSAPFRLDADTVVRFEQYADSYHTRIIVTRGNHQAEMVVSAQEVAASCWYDERFMLNCLIRLQEELDHVYGMRPNGRPVARGAIDQQALARGQMASLQVLADRYAPRDQLFYVQDQYNRQTNAIMNGVTTHGS